MTWVDVDWTHGDTIPEATLDAMQGNIAHVRDQLDGRLVAAADNLRADTVGASTPSPRARVQIVAGSSVLATREYSGTFDYTYSYIDNIDVSSLQVGVLHELAITVAATRTGSVYADPPLSQQSIFPLVRVADLTKITVFLRRRMTWVTEFSPDWYEFTIDSVLIRGHRLTWSL